MNINEKIRKIRETKAWSQEQMAENRICHWMDMPRLSDWSWLFPMLMRKKICWISCLSKR